ncbi:MAG: ComEC/Rec2 family competence protein [Parvibaculales bacterium]
MFLNKVPLFAMTACKAAAVRGISYLRAMADLSSEVALTEMHGERLFYWSPVFFGAGCLAYFSHETEPRLLLGFLIAAIFSLVFIFSTRESLRLFSAVVFMTCAGFIWAQLQTGDKDTPMLSRGLKEATVHGSIIFAEKRRTGSQYVIAVTDIARLRHDQTPERLRLYGKHRHLDFLQPGCRAKIKARLVPLSKPLVPGGYDPRLAAHFKKEGGRGFIREIVDVSCAGPHALGETVARWRVKLAGYLEQVLSPQARGIGIALVTGLRGQIPPDHKQSLRASGLAHMLAISGLHMALMTGSVFGFFRLIGALFPRLNQTVNLAPYCALVAVSSGLVYLLISGGGVATQRAFIMMCLVFLAIVLGRYALTLRNVSLAAMIVLLLAPQSVVMVSFQMSFAAVLALVAFYEHYGRSFWQSGKQGRINRIAYWRRRIMVYFTTLFLTSLIAGAVTGYIAAYHFNMLPVNGLTANLVAMPVFGLIIMPMALCGLVLSPLGLDKPCFWLMSWGIEFVVEVSDWTSKNGEAIFDIPLSPPSALLFFTIGLLGLCLMNGPWRRLAVIPVVAACLLMGRGEVPDILVYGYAHQVAARQADGSYVMMSRSGNLYVAQKWSEIIGAGKPATSDILVCQEDVCPMETAYGKIVRLDTPDLIKQACDGYELVLVPFKVTPKRKLRLSDACRAKLIDRSVWRYEKGQGLMIAAQGSPVWTRVPDTQYDRLWMD